MNTSASEQAVAPPARRWFLYGLSGLVVCLLPAALTLLLLRAVVGATIFDTIPTVNDEIAYWLEIDTFRTAGFNGGFHSTDEQAAPATFCHFGPHGPGFPVVYGLMAKVFGWKPWTGPIFNLLWVTAGLAVWLWAVRPRGWQLAAAAVLIATFWPCLLYIPSTMQESWHAAAAFLLAAAMQRAFVTPPSPRRFAAVVLLIAGFALIRLTWAFVLLPWASVGLRGYSQRGRAAGVAAVTMVFVALVLLSRLLNAQQTILTGLGALNHMVSNIGNSPQMTLAYFSGHAIWNVRNLLLIHGIPPMEALLRYEIMGLLAVATAMAWTRWRDPEGRRLWVFTLLNLGPLLLANILVYDVAEWRDYRVMAPQLLLSLLVLAGNSEWKWSLAPAAANLLCVFPFVAEFSAKHLERVSWDRALVADFRSELQDSLRYEPSKPAWDNTLLVTLDEVKYPLVAVPAGIGVNCVLDWRTVSLPPRSRYLLVPEEFLPELRRHGRVELLNVTRMGALCLNVDANRKADSRGPSR
jgi:hypothetical protein